MTAPDMVSVIAAALAGHQMDGASDRFWDGCRWIVECMCGHESVYTGESSADLDNQAHAAHQARAVLAALGEAGAVEWGVFRKSDPVAAGAFDEAIFKTKAAADAFIKLGFLPHVAERVEARSRITGPWTAVEV